MTENTQKPIRLDTLLEELFGIGQISSKEELEKWIAKMRKLPREILDAEFDWSEAEKGIVRLKKPSE